MVATPPFLPPFPEFEVVRRRRGQSMRLPHSVKRSISSSVLCFVSLASRAAPPPSSPSPPPPEGEGLGVSGSLGGGGGGAGEGPEGRSLSAPAARGSRWRSGSVLEVGWLVTEEAVGGNGCGPLGVAVMRSTSDSSARRQQESDEFCAALTLRTSQKYKDTFGREHHVQQLKGCQLKSQSVGKDSEPQEFVCTDSLKK